MHMKNKKLCLLEYDMHIVNWQRLLAYKPFAEHKQITKIMCKSEENISHVTCPSIAWKVIQQNIVWHLRGNNRLHSNYI